MGNNKTVKELAAKAAAIQPKDQVKPAVEVSKAKGTIPAQQQLNKANATGTVKEITEKKDLKYKYPADCNTLTLRKKFRQITRVKIRVFEREVAKLMAIPEKKRTEEDIKALTKLEKDFTKYAKEVLVPHKQVAEPAK